MMLQHSAGLLRAENASPLFNDVEVMGLAVYLRKMVALVPSWEVNNPIVREAEGILAEVDNRINSSFTPLNVSMAGDNN